MKMKKVLAVLSALCMMCAVVPFTENYFPEQAVLSASAASYTEGTYENLKYKKYADYVEISGVTDKEITEANIPAEIEGLPVTSIGNSAFVYIVPVENVENGFQASACVQLKSVMIPVSVIAIEQSAFVGCKNLMSVTIQNLECEIYDSQYTISDTATIYGYENSTAQAYAEKYGYQFELIGSAPETTEQQELESGDVDGSGKIDILDVITINKAILGKEKLCDEQLKAVDFNGNGKPDAGDSLILMKYIVGLTDTLA